MAALKIMRISTKALKREVLEETGFSCIVGDEIGITIEFRDEWKMVQISHCFKANISSKESGKNFTEEEISDGFELRWCPSRKLLVLWNRICHQNTIVSLCRNAIWLFLKPSFYNS